MAKRVFYDEDARTRILKGAEILYNAVKSTMGPKGRNAVIGKSYGGPTISHDGVTVARAIELDDKDDETLGYKVGAELIKQAAAKMNDVAGDGTTTVTVLTYHILSEANKLIAAGHNPMQLRKGLELAATEVLKNLKGEDISGKKTRVAEVATISAGDGEIGGLIAEVMDKVGKDGVVTVEEGQGLELESEVVEGFTFDRGFVSALMVTDSARLEAVYDKPSILITDKKISSVAEFLPLLEKLAASGSKDLVIIAEDVDGEALTTLVLNKLKGVFNSVAVKAPSFGDRRKDILEDIAILTGGEVISEDRGITFESADISMLGRARKVIVTKDDTTIVEGAGSAPAVKARIEQINQQINSADKHEVEDLQKRRAALGGKVAVIKVGGATETEIEEKKFRVDDAVAAVKAALDEGIVAGGSVAYIDLATTLANSARSSKNFGKALDELAADPVKGLLFRALCQPFQQIMLNAGVDDPSVLLQKVLKAGNGMGYDVNNATGEPIDVKKKGIVDPARVVKEAIQNAVSLAGTGMTMGALVVEIPEKTAPSAPAGMDMGY